jgi:(2Fe-2S) ferredoxin
MVVYPAGSWYGEVDEAKVDTILDALKEGKEATDLLLC